MSDEMHRLDDHRQPSVLRGVITAGITLFVVMTMLEASGPGLGPWEVFVVVVAAVLVGVTAGRGARPREVLRPNERHH